MPVYPRGTRRPLPDHRNSNTQHVTIGGRDVYLHVDEYEDGSPGEIWINMPKVGEVLQHMLNQFAATVSLNLQFGVPLDVLVDQFVYVRFGPDGIVEGHASIKICTSVVDFVSRYLGVTYLKREDLGHMSIPGFATEAPPKEALKPSTTVSPLHLAKKTDET